MNKEYEGDENRICAGINRDRVVAIFTDKEMRSRNLTESFEAVMDITGKDVEIGDELIHSNYSMKLKKEYEDAG